MAAAERVITGVLEGAKGLIHGLTCGAGMPYRLSDIAAKFNVHYYPIVSSARAFNALWRRAYSKAASLLGGVVYEDPWLAGGHNGLSNGEDPTRPEDPFPRVLALRKLMRELGLGETPIIMAGGVWWLEEWEGWIDNPDLGPIAFQFGTRPLLTTESPIGEAWKRRLMTLKEGDVFLNRFSPTGFYSSAVNNDFIAELRERTETSGRLHDRGGGRACRRVRGRPAQAHRLSDAGRSAARADVGGGGSHRGAAHPGTARWSSSPRRKPPRSWPISRPAWAASAPAASRTGSSTSRSFSTGKKADPRSFCIQKTLQDIGHTGDDDAAVERNLMFAGHNAYRFAQRSVLWEQFRPHRATVGRADSHGAIGRGRRLAQRVALAAPISNGAPTLLPK